MYRILVLLALLPGCAVHRHFSPVFPDSKWTACNSYGFCGPDAGAYMVGSSVCYAEDLKKPFQRYQCR